MQKGDGAVGDAAVGAAPWLEDPGGIGQLGVHARPGTSSVFEGRHFGGDHEKIGTTDRHEDEASAGREKRRDVNARRPQAGATPGRASWWIDGESALKLACAVCRARALRHDDFLDVACADDRPGDALRRVVENRWTAVRPRLARYAILTIRCAARCKGV